MTKSQDFIARHRKKLSNCADFFNPDSNRMRAEEYDNAKCRILIVFPTAHSVKTVSSTAAALNDYVIRHCPDTFIDFAYLPEDKDIKLFDKYILPYGIGEITHLDASHFDIVGFSISTISDLLSATTMMASWRRCDKPIPSFWTDRKDLKIGECPVIYAGGITLAFGELLYGEVPTSEGIKQGIIDFGYLGECDKTDVLVRRFIDAKTTGVVKRYQADHDKVGYEHVDEPDFIEDYPVSTIQDFVECNFDCDWIYQGQAYKVVYNKYNRIISNTKVNPKARDFVMPYYPHKLEPDLGIGRTIISGNGDHVHMAETKISEGCSAGGACSFCAEGNYSGGHVEKTMQEVIDNMWEAKLYNAADCYRPYSFNSNYFTNYKGLLMEMLKIYPRASFINMRMEELGRDTDALEMLKDTGSNRLSAPMEGLSPRIQNNLLNKCLSDEARDNFFNTYLHLRMTELKMGMIYTKYEEDEDFQWIYDYIQGLRQKARETGGNIPVRMKATPLVHYSLTPLEYLERRSARWSFYRFHWMSDEWYNKYRDANISFKVNGFLGSTCLEQSIVDLGRRLSPLLYKYFMIQETPIRTQKNLDSNEGYMKELYYMLNPYRDKLMAGTLTPEEKIESDKYDEGAFGDRHIESYISPCHRIHIELYGSYIPRARKLLKAKAAGDVFKNIPDIRCLKTYEGCKNHCYFRDCKDEPLKVYNDVELVDGALVGPSRDLIGCERCQSTEERKWRLGRDLTATANKDDMKALPRIPEVLKTRFVVERLTPYEVVNPNNTAYSTIARLLRTDERLLKAYHSVDIHSNYWQSDPQGKMQFAGTMLVDVIWNKNVYNIIQENIEKANEMLQASKIISVQEIMKEEKIKVTDYNIWSFETTIPFEFLDAAKYRYKGSVRTFGARDMVEVIDDPALIPLKPIFVKQGGVTKGVMVVPCKYNPCEVFSGYVSTAKRQGLDDTLDKTSFIQHMTVRETKIPAKVGNENALVSLYTGSNLGIGKLNIAKVILNKIIKAGTNA